MAAPRTVISEPGRNAFGTVTEQPTGSSAVVTSHPPSRVSFGSVPSRSVASRWTRAARRSPAGVTARARTDSVAPGSTSPRPGSAIATYISAGCTIAEASAASAWRSRSMTSAAHSTRSGPLIPGSASDAGNDADPRASSAPVARATSRGGVGRLSSTTVKPWSPGTVTHVCDRRTTTVTRAPAITPPWR